MSSEQGKSIEGKTHQFIFCRYSYFHVIPKILRTAHGTTLDSRLLGVRRGNCSLEQRAEKRLPRLLLGCMNPLPPKAVFVEWLWCRDPNQLGSSMLSGQLGDSTTDMYHFRPCPSTSPAMGRVAPVFCAPVLCTAGFGV